MITVEKLDQVMAEELAGATGGKFQEAKSLFRSLSLADQFEEFLTIPAYRQLVASES